MAERDLTYKIQLDDSDLTQKLSQIKDQIDLALTGQSFGMPTGLGEAIPRTFGSIAQGLNPLPMFQNYMSPTQAGIAIADNTLTNAYTQANVSLGVGQESIHQAYQKIADSSALAQATFSNTLDRVTPDGRSISPSEANFGITGDEGWMRNLIGSKTGIGYDPDFSVSRGTMREMQAHRLGYNLPDAMGGIAGFGLGFLGAGMGPMGLAAGLAMGFAGEKVLGGALNMLFAPAMQDMQTADYTNMSVLQRGTFLKGQAGQSMFSGVGSDVASSMREFTRSTEGFLAGVSRPEAEQAFKTFTEMGGFDTARTSEEYMRRFDDMLEGHKKVMHALNTSQEKALKFMAEMQNRGLDGTAESAQTLTALGQTVGLAGRALVEYGLQSQQMAWQMLPGVSAKGGFTMGVASLMTAQQMAREGIYDNDIIARMGGGETGVQNIARSLQEVAYRSANTPLGKMQLQVGRKGLGMDSSDLIGAGLGTMRNMNEMVNYASGVNTGKLFEDIGPMNMNLSTMNRLVQDMDAFGFERGANNKYAGTDIMGMLMYKEGLTRDQAEAMVLTIGQKQRTQGEGFQEAFTRLLDIQRAEEPTGLQKSIAGIKSGYATLSDNLLQPMGAGMLVGGALGTGVAGASLLGTIGAAGGFAGGGFFGTIGAGAGLAGGAALLAPIGIGLAAGAVGLGAYGLIRGKRGRTRDYEAITEGLSNLLTGVPPVDVSMVSRTGQMTDEERTELYAEAERVKEKYDLKPHLSEGMIGWRRPGRNFMGMKYLNQGTTIDAFTGETMISPIVAELDRLAEDPNLAGLIPMDNIVGLAKQYAKGTERVFSTKVTDLLDAKFETNKKEYQAFLLSQGEVEVEKNMGAIGAQFDLGVSTFDEALNLITSPQWKPVSPEQKALYRTFGSGKSTAEEMRIAFKSFAVMPDENKIKNLNTVQSMEDYWRFSEQPELLAQLKSDISLEDLQNDQTKKFLVDLSNIAGKSPEAVAAIGVGYEKRSAMAAEELLRAFKAGEINT